MNHNSNIMKHIDIIRLYIDFCIQKNTAHSAKDTIIKEVREMIVSFTPNALSLDTNYPNQIEEIFAKMMRKSISKYDGKYILKLLKIYDSIFETNYFDKMFTKRGRHFILVNQDTKQTNISVENEIYKNEDAYNYLISRGVKHLVHFTNVKNLHSIMKYGLLSRSNLCFFEISNERNDENSQEILSRYISVSISFPNYRMLYKIRNLKNHDKFVILLIDLEILKYCTFKMFSSNAATANGKFLVNNIEQLFIGSENRIVIPDNYTTDPEAELRIYGSIPPNYINTICFDNFINMEDFKKTHFIFDDSKIKMEVRSDLFKYRNDYEFWKKESK